jgi:hypothetical protein
VGISQLITESAIPILEEMREPSFKQDSAEPVKINATNLNKAR